MVSAQCRELLLGMIQVHQSIIVVMAKNTNPDPVKQATSPISRASESQKRESFPPRCVGRQVIQFTKIVKER